MSKLKKEYNELIEQRQEFIKEIELLEENETVKRYIELKRKNEALYFKQLNLYRDIKYKEYKSCKHISVYSEIEHDRYEERSYKSCGCIKCGLDTSVLNYARKRLPFAKQIMYDYLKENYFMGIKTGIECDLDLAQAIYSKIKEANPNIDDITARKDFEIALDNIRNIKVSEDRKVSRAKRLSLNPDFKRWNASDVHND